MILINNVASRYLSPSRIVIEFVDNSIDDMEGSYNSEDNSYPRRVNINVHINSKKNYVRIVDNANGMDVDTLTRLVSNVGDSSKRKSSNGVSTVNGRFGFGLQSFRAAAQKINIISSQGGAEDLFQLSFTRDQAHDITAPLQLSRDAYGSFPGECASGTDITIEQWKDDWLAGYGGAKKLQEQLQRHFERLLHRSNIQLCVIDDARDVRYKCLPVDYTALSSSEDNHITCQEGDGDSNNIIKQRIYLTGRQQKEFIDVFFIILPKESKGKDRDGGHYPVNMFCNGRRVSSVRYLKSFMRKSKNAWIWNHPLLVGYVDAACLTPVITRDEFKKNVMRNKVYQALYTLEGDLSTRLEKHGHNYIRSDETFQKLEGVINSALSSVVREEKRGRMARDRYSSMELYGGEGGDSERNDRELQEGVCVTITSESEGSAADTLQSPLELSTTPATNNDDSPTSLDAQAIPQEPKNKHQTDTSIARGVGLGVKFVTHLEDNRRAKLVGSYIEIDVTHPDFETRVSSKDGNPRLTERLLGYIANVVSAAYRSRVHSSGSGGSDAAGDALAPPGGGSDSDLIYDEMLDSIVESSTKLEETLQKRLPALQKEINLMMSNSRVVSDEGDGAADIA
jgi:hypothetical protein